MSRHEGVSCDSCLKSNFIGRRYKCLICYDYDLCADCYEEGATSTRHLVDHPMQCILTRSDIDLYYGGEMLNSEQPQSFTCPYCKKMGFSDSSLLEHVGTEHTDTGLEVVCPVCAGQPGGDPNLVTDDFAGHLTLEHRSGPRDLISFLDEPSAIRHGGVRRIPGRALGGPRSRRSNMHFSSSGLSALSPSGRESVDPIAELLSQLSGVRRGTSQPSQLQQLQMQMQMERQATNRQQLERLPRRQAHAVVTSNANNSVQDVVASGSSSIGAAPNNINANGIISSSSGQQSQTNIVVSSINTRDAPLNSSSFPLSVTSVGLTTLQGNNLNDGQSQFLLSRFMSPSLDESDLSLLEKDRADRSQYVQALILSTLSSIQIKNTTKSEKRGESQETNSDNVNSETNNDSGDDKDDSNVKRDCTGEIVRDGDVSFNIGVAGTDNRQQGFDGEFLEEYTLQQQQNFCSSGNKKKMSGAAGSKSNISQNTAILLERRGRPPLSGNSSQQEKTNRDLKSNTLSTKEIPDSR